jgi:signal transduction histidine kinase
MTAAPLSILVGEVTLSMMFFRETLRCQPTWLVLLEALVLVGLIGWVDHVTSPEWSCFAPYAVPIVLVTWKTSRRLGFVCAFLCAATYWLSDYGNNPYQTRWGFELAVAGWWFYFSVLVVAVTALKVRRELDRMRIETLERTQALERQILRTTEREQQRIGRDLHDGLGPQLAAIRYAATFLANQLRQRGRPEAAKAEQLCQLTGDAGSLARDLARGIFPVQMDGVGLATALKDLAGTTSQLTRIPVSFFEMGEVIVADPEAGMHLYRIAQEAVNNAVKHGDAKKITIALNQCENSLRLTVADDGKGMAPSPGGTRGMGLDSMRYRARVLGDELKIDSQPGEGTIVSCEMPNPPPRPRP